MELNKPDWLLQTEGLLETLNEGVLIIDDCNHVISVNDCLSRMVGWSREELLGRTPEQFYRDEDLTFVRKQISHGQERGHHRYEFYLPHRDGHRVPVVIASRLIEDLDGRQFEIATFSDITEQKSAQEKLRQANLLLEERQREIDYELSLAARVQQSIAPQNLQWGRVTVEAFYSPVQTIGGDFGLVAPVGDASLNLLVCDVSGHGICSALIANRIYSEAVAQIERGAEMAAMLHRLNTFVLQQISTTGFYFTMAAARLESGGRDLTFAGAGHPPAIWASRGGECRLLEARSAVLGLLDDAVGSDPAEKVSLNPGDRLLLYTDGISEAANEKDELLGSARLQEIVKDTAHLKLAETKNAILDRVAAWRHGPVADDVSLVLLEFN